MRRLVTRKRLKQFMAALGREARAPGRVYLTGGASAVLFEWRLSTIDVDLKLEPDNNEMMRAIPALKESLAVNGAGLAGRLHSRAAAVAGTQPIHHA